MAALPPAVRRADDDADRIYRGAGKGDLAMRGDSLADIAIFHARRGPRCRPGSGGFCTIPDPGEGESVSRLGWRWKSALVRGLENNNSNCASKPLMEPVSCLSISRRRHLSTICELFSRPGTAISGPAPATLWVCSTTAHYGMLGAKDGFTDKVFFRLIETPDGHIILGGRESITEYDGKSFRS